MTIVVVGGMTVDDIVLQTGNVHRRVAGGNALYCALGSRLWGERTEIVSFVGHDYPSEVLHDLTHAGIGTQYVTMTDGPSIRLWILYEQDGMRQIHLQNRSATLNQLASSGVAMLGRLLSTAPPEAAHIAALPVRTQRALAQTLRKAGVPFTLDSLEAKGSVGGDLADYLKGPDLAPDAFLPSRAEFALLFGEEGSSSFQDWSHRTTTSSLVIKDGRQGCVVATPPGAPGVRIPALDCVEVDPTGAGDAFCGGFVAGLAQRRSARECALMGAVSASFVVEAVGATGLFRATGEEAEERFSALELRIEDPV